MGGSAPRRSQGPYVGRVQGGVTRYDYVKDGLLVTDYVRVKKETPASVYVPTSEYHPTLIVVICSCPGCRMIGTVDFPNGFDFRKGDSLMAGKSVVGTCPSCRTGKPHEIMNRDGTLDRIVPCIGPDVELIPYEKASKFVARSQQLLKQIAGIS